MPIDNKKVQTQPLPQILPKHPHRILYILLSILIFVLVSGAIVMYQIRMVSPVVESPPSSQDSNPDLRILRTLKQGSSESVSQEDMLKTLKSISSKSKAYTNNNK